MIETAENLRREYAVSRADQDALALRSQQRAGAALAEGRFAAETVPVTVRTRKGETEIGTDEHPRPETTADQLAALRPVRLAEDPEATVTAGNASGQNDDAAAACLVTSAQTAERLGLRPLVRLVSFARAGVPAETMGLGPVGATREALAKARLDLADIDLIELNEAFAAQVLACTRALGLTERDHETRINVNGSGISLGHPVGATGARVLATLAHEMRRAAAPATAWRRCASAAARGSPRSSNAYRTRAERPPGGGPLPDGGAERACRGRRADRTVRGRPSRGRGAA